MAVTQRMGGSMENSGKPIKYTSYGGKPTTPMAKPMVKKAVSATKKFNPVKYENAKKKVFGIPKTKY